jgi:transposase
MKHRKPSKRSYASLPFSSVRQIVERLLSAGLRVRRVDSHTLRATCPCCNRPDKLEIRSTGGPIPFLAGVDDPTDTTPAA